MFKNTNELLLEAKKYLKKVDVILDLYDLTFTYVNSKVVKKFGFEKKKLIGKNILDYTEYEKNTVNKTIIKLMTGIPINQKIPIIYDGHKYFLFLKNRYFEYSGGPYCAVEILKVRKR